MKTMRLFLGLGLAATLAVPAVALEWPEDGGGRRAKMIEKFDSNKDGKLDDAEREAAHQAMEKFHAERRAEMLAKYDTDKNGELSDEERAAAQKDHAKLRFQELDKNQDGVLSFEEFAAGGPKMGRGHGFGHGPGHGPGFGHGPGPR